MENYSELISDHKPRHWLGDSRSYIRGFVSTPLQLAEVKSSWSPNYCHIMMHDARDLIHSLLQSEICKLIYKNINNIHIIRKIVSQNWLSICVYLISPQIKLSEVLICYYIKSLLGFLNNVYMFIYLHSHVSPMLAPWIFLSGNSPIACVVWKLSPGIYSFIIHSNRWYITKCNT